MARAPIDSLTPGNWKCGKDFSTNCLPDSYSTTSRDVWESMLQKPGPNVLPILSAASYPGITSFSVSAIAGTSPQKFVGVAEQFSGSGGTIKVFTSTDLVTWALQSTPLTYTGTWTGVDVPHYRRAKGF